MSKHSLKVYYNLRAIFHLYTSHYFILYIEHSVGNTVRKILHHIREEYNTASKETVSTSSKPVYSISTFVLQGQPRKHTVGAPKSEATLTLKENDPDDPDSFARVLKPVFMEAIQDVLDELETVYDNISKNSKDHIHSEYVRQVHIRTLTDSTYFPSEIILTIGNSKTVESFLKAAAHYRNFTVIVAETGPSYLFPRHLIMNPRLI